jgi:hypothetical protein
MCLSLIKCLLNLCQYRENSLLDGIEDIDIYRLLFSFVDMISLSNI